MMNRIERYIYIRLKKHPKIKNAVVDAYQRACWFMPCTPVVKFDIRLREGYFFGFHDKCPWSYDDRLLLAHRYDGIPHRLPRPGEEAAIGFFHGKDFMHFERIAKTRTWNWQQGSNLQWVGKTLKIIFNDLEGSHYCARIIDRYSHELAVLPKPIAAVSPGGDSFISYSFERLRRFSPGYSYPYALDRQAGENLPPFDGLFVLRSDSFNAEKLFSLREIAGIEPDVSMRGAYHFFSHALFAPSGRRFVFFHRWTGPKGRLFTRMFSCGISGDDIHLFPTSGMVSHLCWLDDETIVAYAETGEHGEGYHLFTDRTDRCRVLAAEHLVSDGHPQVSNNGRYLLTDTYPDRLRRQSLIVYDIKEKKYDEIVRLRIPLKFRYDLRCDFHPRWNNRCTMICFDSAHSGTRAMCTLSMEN